MDVAAWVAKPAEPTRWVVGPLVAAGTLTILVAKHSVGKTWALYDAADSVARGITTEAGLSGTPGKALVIDAEMGPHLVADRFRDHGYSTDIAVYNTNDIDLTTEQGRRDLRMILEIEDPTFVGIDSLRRIARSAKEDSSDSMGEVAAYLHELSREFDVGVLVLHHEGHKTGRSRGTIAILDSADAVWELRHAVPDAAKGSREAELRELSSSGASAKPPRYAPPQSDLYLRIPAAGGLLSADAPPPKRTADDYRDLILAALPQPTVVAVANAIGTTSQNSAFNAMWKSLKAEQRVSKSDGAYRANELLAESPVI